ncbi:MAG: Sjogren's syndrome/scleroderma autoantigen 1 family protein, partial [Ignisphaera sp.]
MDEDVDKETKEVALKRAVELIRSGAALLSEVCPICKSPLLKLRSGETVCPIHGKVMIVKTEEEVAEASVLSTLVELEKRVSRILVMYVKKIDEGEISHEYARDIIYWLDALERVERIKQVLKYQPPYTI